MAQQSFSAAVDAWVQKSRQRIDVVFKEALQDTVEAMQQPGPSKRNPDSTGGGNMPIDTGFLRASLQVGINQVPPLRGTGNSKGTYAYEPSTVELGINNASPGDTVYVIYGANYAAIVEYGGEGREGRGFVRLAAQRWPEFVQGAISRAKARFP